MSKLIVGLTAGLLFGTLASEASHRSPGLYTIYGAGNLSCGTYAEQSRGTQLSWILGFVSGVGSQAFLEETDRAAIEAWIRHYCHMYPLQTVAAASTSLVVTLAQRQGDRR